MNLDELKTLVGQEYVEFDNNGNYIGCFAPMYALWSDMPRYKLPERSSGYFETALTHFLEKFLPVKTPIPSDVAVFRLPGGIFHIGIFLGDNMFLHLQRGNKVEIRRFAPFKKYLLDFFRRRDSSRCSE